MRENMIIIFGLGNPGEKFENTRHNMGFMAVDFFAKKNDFSDFTLEKKYDALISERPFDTAQGKQKVLLAKPQTFMNKSGIAVKKIVAKNKKVNLIVLHDDIDLPLGKFKIVKNRGSAGHKGVESIIKAIGNKNLVRLRIGIQPEKGKLKAPEGFVIKKFSADDEAAVKKVLKRISEALDYFIEHGLEKTMNEYNRPNK